MALRKWGTFNGWVGLQLGPGCILGGKDIDQVCWAPEKGRARQTRTQVRGLRRTGCLGSTNVLPDAPPILSEP